MTKFPVGTVVQLKSGGPKMTVTGPATGLENAAWCEWLEDGGKPGGRSYPDESLKLVTDEKGNG